MTEARWIKKLTTLLGRPEHAVPFESPQAFCQLYQQNYLSVYRYLFGFCGGRVEDIEDLTAETFLRAWRSRRSFTGDPQKATGWLLRIARRLTIDAYRRQTVRIQPEIVPVDEIPQPALHLEQQLITAEQKDALWKQLQKLPCDQREMLVLRYLLEWRVSQIAEFLGIAENTVSVTIRRCLARLQRDWPCEED